MGPRPETERRRQEQARRPREGDQSQVVLDTVGRIDLADDIPEILVVIQELAFVGLLEFLLQRRAFPVEGEEGFLDLVLKLGLEVVDNAEAGGREGLRLVDRLDLVGGDHLALDHPAHHRVGDGSSG
jgi:hypothetical protein